MNPPPTKPTVDARNKITVINKVTILFFLLFNDQTKIPEIAPVSLDNPASKPYSIRPKKECLLICDNFPKREYNHGTNVNDTNRDNNVATTTVTQNWRKISDTNPDDIAIGRNTTIITRVIAVTVNPISFAPSNAARTLFLPISIWRWIFSITTMASSTTIPTTNESPNSVIRFSVYPKRFKAMNVPINDNGIAKLAIPASRKLCRKNSIINTTRTTAIAKSIITWFAALIV